MYKATVVATALEGFLRKMGWWDFIRVSDKYDMLSYAIAEDCPEEARKEFKIRLNQMVESVNGEYKLAYIQEAPMSTVTRDKKLWNK